MSRIAFAGKMRSGKDTAADIILKKYPYYNTLAFADGIKKVIELCFPEELKEGKKPREFYQFIGQQLRSLNPQVWVNFTNRELQKLKYSSNVLITDCRQLNEVQFLKENGFLIIKVEADDNKRLQRIKDSNEDITIEQFYHSTETTVDLIKPNFLITNNGTLDELREKVEKLLQDLKFREERRQKL